MFYQIYYILVFISDLLCCGFQVLQTGQRSLWPRPALGGTCGPRRALECWRVPSCRTGPSGDGHSYPTAREECIWGEGRALKMFRHRLSKDYHTYTTPTTGGGRQISFHWPASWVGFKLWARGDFLFMVDIFISSTHETLDTLFLCIKQLIFSLSANQLSYQTSNLSVYIFLQFFC